MSAKVALLVALSVSASVASYFIHKFIAIAKKRSDGRKFSSRRYRAGAAIVNMERAIAYGDDENFRFFARYAMRTCLGLPNSYPPDEPTEEDIRCAIEMAQLDGALAEMVLGIYRMGELPDDSEKWKPLLEDVRTAAERLFDLHFPGESGGER